MCSGNLSYAVESFPCASVAWLAEIVSVMEGCSAESMIWFTLSLSNFHTEICVFSGKGCTELFICDWVWFFNVKCVSKVYWAVMTIVERYRSLFIYFKFSWGMYRILRSALFWEIMQCRGVISYQHLGTTYQCHLFSWKCPKTSVQNYYCTLCNVWEECRSHLHCGASLKLCVESGRFNHWLNGGTCRSENVILRFLSSWHQSLSLIPGSPVGRVAVGQVF
jgi:hypothetical protein